MMIKTAFIIYLVVLVLSPLLFATVHTFAYTFTFLGILAATLLLLKSYIIKNVGQAPSSEGRERFKKGGFGTNFCSYQFRLPSTLMNPLYLVFLVFLIIQMIPLPGTLLVKLSPEAKIAGDMSMPAVSALAPSGITGRWHHLAPYIYPVRMSLVRWVVYGLLFFGLIQTMNSRRRIETAIIMVLAAGCFEALYGIIQTYSGQSHIWWFKSLAGPRDVSGTYINRNHFAGFMGMGIILAVAYAGALSDRNKSGQITSGYNGGIRAKLLKYLSGERIFTRRFLIIFAGVVMGLGLILSASRGGIISAAGGLLMMGLFFAFRKDHRRKGIIILVLFSLTAIYAFHIGIDYTLGRFQVIDKDFESRARYARKTMDISADYRFTGVGVGNFPYAYPRYQDQEDKGDFIEYAHNDWAQFLAEGGRAGILLLLAGTGYYLFGTIKLCAGRRDPFAVCLGIAPVAVLFAVAGHSFFDFNLHIPANFLMLTAIAAIGTGALQMERRHHRQASELSYRFLSFRRGAVPVLLLSVILILLTGIWIIRHFMAEVHCNTIITSPLNLDQHPPLEEIQKAIYWDGGNAEYYHKLATALMKIRDQEAQSGSRGGGTSSQPNEKCYQLNRPIIAALEKAILLNPLNAEYHTRLGWEYSYLWREADYMSKWLPAADISMERASYLAGNWALNPRLHVDLGNYWTMRSKTFGPHDPASEETWIKAIWHYHKAQEMDNSKGLDEEIKRYVKMMRG